MVLVRITCVGVNEHASERMVSDYYLVDLSGNHILAGATVRDEPRENCSCLMRVERVDLKHGRRVRPCSTGQACTRCNRQRSTYRQACPRIYQGGATCIG